jgi:hypothetical protein
MRSVPEETDFIKKIAGPQAFRLQPDVVPRKQPILSVVAPLSPSQKSSQQPRFEALKTGREALREATPNCPVKTGAISAPLSPETAWPPGAELLNRGIPTCRDSGDFMPPSNSPPFSPAPRSIQAGQGWQWSSDGSAELQIWIRWLWAMLRLFTACPTLAAGSAGAVCK